MSQHHPRLYSTRRYGSWATCDCGRWVSRRWATVTGAHLDFGRHLVAATIDRNQRKEEEMTMEPLDINRLPDELAQHWASIEAHFREKIAREIETDDTPAPWPAVPGVARTVRNRSWIDSHDGAKAAWIARGRPGEAAEGR